MHVGMPTSEDTFLKAIYKNYRWQQWTALARVQQNHVWLYQSQQVIRFLFTDFLSNVFLRKLTLNYAKLIVIYVYCYVDMYYDFVNRILTNNSENFWKLF